MFRKFIRSIILWAIHDDLKVVVSVEVAKNDLDLPKRIRDALPQQISDHARRFG